MLLKFIVLVFIIAILLRIFSPILNKDSLLVRLFNRYTFNVVPNTLGIISTIFGSGIALIHGGALLLGFFSGFYALYKGTDLLVSHIKWQVTSIKTEGEVLNADNKRNMSQALVFRIKMVRNMSLFIRQIIMARSLPLVRYCPFTIRKMRR